MVGGGKGKEKVAAKSNQTPYHHHVGRCQPLSKHPRRNLANLGHLDEGAGVDDQPSDPAPERLLLMMLLLMLSMLLLMTMMRMRILLLLLLLMRMRMRMRMRMGMLLLLLLLLTLMWIKYRALGPRAMLMRMLMLTGSLLRIV